MKILYFFNELFSFYNQIHSRVQFYEFWVLLTCLWIMSLDLTKQGQLRWEIMGFIGTSKSNSITWCIKISCFSSHNWQVNQTNYGTRLDNLLLLFDLKRKGAATISFVKPLAIENATRKIYTSQQLLYWRYCNGIIPINLWL